MSSLQDPLSGLQWHEPIEGLEFGEFFIGAIASTYLVRGRFFGYAFCLTDRRIIGLKIRGASMSVAIPFLTAVIALYILAFYETLSGANPLVFLLPLLVHASTFPLGIVERKLAENNIARKAKDTPSLLRRRRDFEIRRNAIEELLMKSLGRGLNLGMNAGYLRIFPKDHAIKFLEVKIKGWKQSQKLRDLVINFSAREPRVRAMEYPPS